MQIAPAPGYRHRDHGTLFYVGDYGFSWSSTEAGTNAHGLYFNYARIVPQDLYYRGYGFPLRCLQE